MSWPLSQDYNEAIQDPRNSFSDAELKTGEAVANALGIPMPRSGNFADVYEVRCRSGTRWAVKCFTREVFGLRERYAEIGKYLRLAKLPFMVDFQYLEQGIRVRGQWYPILKMQWVEGFLLNEFVRDNLDKKPILQALGQIWLKMARRLRESYIAHCDLQHGNVLFVPGSTASSLAVKLIDYDGMCVPSLVGTKSGEVGHPAYQHPERLRTGAYDQEVDRFSLLLIATSLRCLSIGGRSLWERYDTGDNLLFRQSDLQAPARSPLFQELLAINDPQARELVNTLFRACQGPLDAVPLLTDLLPELQTSVTPKPASKRAMGLTASAAELAGETTATDSAWDFEGEDERPSFRRRRKGGMPRWVWNAVAVVVVGLVLAGGIVALGLWKGSEKPKDETRSDQNGSKNRSQRRRKPQSPKGSQSETVLEGEDLQIFLKSSNFPAWSQDMSPFSNDTWSGSRQLFCQPQQKGEWIDLELPITAAGKYRVVVYMTKARDYGIVQLSLDGKPTGEVIDGYHFPTVERTEAIDLGIVKLKTDSTLRIEAVDTNENSVGPRYQFGLDCVVLRPALP
ncbi:MAG TPA: hypothetical protein VMG10_27950 [Gemmataceae bacterium]|nr:hypothetical protein [Gemmataceae bacterium]